MRYIWKRGNVYWFRMRCPKKYFDVLGKEYICRSLETDSKSHAEAKAALLKIEVLEELQARMLGKASPRDISTHRSLIGLARTSGVAPKTSIELADGDITELVRRLANLRLTDPNAETAKFAAQMGGFENPGTLVSELAKNMPELRQDQIVEKNPRQIRTWHNRYKRAAKVFADTVGDMPINQVTTGDAGKYMLYWDDRVRKRECTTAHANKHISYLRAMVDAYYREIECVQYSNPFKGLKISPSSTWERNEVKVRKAEFSPAWIQQTIIDGAQLAGMNEEERDILAIVAETGCRQTEIYDAPGSAFRLDAKIPHVLIQVENEGEERREIKNRASYRQVPLVGAALEAAKRHPNGFPRYRGNGNFSGSAGKYLRENDLLPSKRHKLSSLRHSYESRLMNAGIDNETRAFLMGHSLRRIRGREVYGDELSLELRVLYAEMVAFPTKAWSPRSKEELQKEIDNILSSKDFSR